MISVIIPTYNRFDSLLKAVESVKNQTYQNIEIIVVDDNSTDERYENQIIHGVKLIKIEEGSKEILGYSCDALPRNIGMECANGEYIAFLDDDDVWMPNKLEVQINEMEKNNIDMSSTDGYIGKGTYDSDKNYKLYNRLKNAYKNRYLNGVDKMNNNLIYNTLIKHLNFLLTKNKINLIHNLMVR